MNAVSRLAEPASVCLHRLLLTTNPRAEAQSKSSSTGTFLRAFDHRWQSCEQFCSQQESLSCRIDSAPDDVTMSYVVSKINYASKFDARILLVIRRGCSSNRKTMMNKIKCSVMLTAGVLFLAASSFAQAELYDISFTGSTFGVSAEVSTNDTTNVISSILTGTITGPTIGSPALVLDAPGSNASFINDNVLVGTSPFVTNGGILFDAGGSTYNLYSIGSGPVGYYLFSINSPDATDFDSGDPGTLVVTDEGPSPVGGPSPVAAVPEASTWLMLILGFCGLGFMGYRRKSKIAFQAPAVL